MRETLKALDHLEAREEITIAAAIYKYGRKHGNEGREEKQTAIYNALRAWAKVCRVVPLDKLIESSGAEESYVRRYLRFLARLGYVTKRPTGWAVLDKAMNDARPPLFKQRQEAANGGE
jgi:DeoR/GlpR family transcriptional regulator of sugar metabolism